MFSSVSYVAMNTALDGLALRQRVIADNVANIQTPGFLAGRVSFEESLAAAVRNGSGVAQTGITRSMAAPREDGNNVNLEQETLLNIQTQLRYQLATQAVNGTFSKLRAAFRSA
ncbi:MAG TPA: flagellar basal body protein [Actinotalea sp.]|nr:flagellar basal body protein [Actinotalea sp.]